MSTATIKSIKQRLDEYLKAQEAGSHPTADEALAKIVDLLDEDEDSERSVLGKHVTRRWTPERGRIEYT